MNNDMLECSFCGRGKAKVHNLIAGYKGVICDMCVEICLDILYDKTSSKLVKKSYVSNNDKKSPLPFSSPRDIYNLLDKTVEGQDSAKKAVSVAIFTHCVINNLIPNVKTSINRALRNSHLLLVGDTGTGKTFLVNRAAEIAGINVISCPAHVVSEVGYHGFDASDFFTKFIADKMAQGISLEEAKKLTETCIFHIDEVDKIAMLSERSGTPDVSRGGAQKSFLTLLEGAPLHIPMSLGKKAGIAENITVNTNKMLGICTGAFIGLDKIIERRLNKGTFGFRDSKNISTLFNSSKSILSQATPADIVSFGMMREFVGRISAIKVMDQLTKENLVAILSKKDSSLVKEYKDILNACGVNISFSEEAISYIAELALQRELGARSLREIMTSVMSQVIFEVDTNKTIGSNEEQVIFIDNNFVKSALSNEPINNKNNEPSSVESASYG